MKNWVRDLVPFLKEYIEPISISVMDISSVIEFVRALSELVVIKADIHLMSCLDNNDNLTFARILEESITYEREVGQVLIDVVTTSKSFLPPLVSTLFSQTHILKQWLVIEKAGRYKYSIILLINPCQKSNLRSCFKKLVRKNWMKYFRHLQHGIVQLFLAHLR